MFLVQCSSVKNMFNTMIYYVLTKESISQAANISVNFYFYEYNKKKKVGSRQRSVPLLYFMFSSAQCSMHVCIFQFPITDRYKFQTDENRKRFVKIYTLFYQFSNLSDSMAARRGFQRQIYGSIYGHPVFFLRRIAYESRYENRSSLIFGGSTACFPSNRPFFYSFYCLRLLVHRFAGRF